MGIAELDWESQDPPGPATESSRERGYTPDPDVEARRGRHEELDDDEVSDIADEGAGHRG
jgi:hypothetical protein